MQIGRETDISVEAKGLVKTYRGDVCALDGLSLVAETDTVFGLLGPNGVALLSRREQTMIAVSNFALLPQWMQVVAQYNRVYWAVPAGREALAAPGDWSMVLSRMGYLAVFTAACTWLATRAFRVDQRSI